MSFVIIAVALIIALSVHEYAHARVADELGDPTPRLNGRLTLNPLAHFDPLGTLALIFFRFGWGKPVPIDPYNLRNPKRDQALISLAGPASNFVVAVIFAVLYRILPGLVSGITLQLFLAQLIQTTVVLNLGLGLFNLLPIGPLDGLKILLGILPTEIGVELEDTMRRYGLIILLLILFLPVPGTSSSLIGLIFGPVLMTVSNFLLGGIF